MDIIQAQASSSWTRYIPGQKAGHYEIFFLRANNPVRALAFWIRYTIFSPHDHPENAIGELRVISFNGETGQQINLTAANRTEFEILTDKNDRGLKPVV